jgi:hypothetical protein
VVCARVKAREEGRNREMDKEGASQTPSKIVWGGNQLQEGKKGRWATHPSITACFNYIGLGADKTRRSNKSAQVHTR